MPYLQLPRRLWPALALVVAVCLSAQSAAAERRPLVVYDGDLGGYVAVADGIARPDLVVRRESGVVPESERRARWRARRSLRRDAAFAGREAPDRPRRRWLRRTAVVSDLLVLGPDEAPVEGARVYRYSNPSFYAVNKTADGRRLFDELRYLPYPLPSETAVATVERFEILWHDEELSSVAAVDGVLDRWHNPWLRQGVEQQRYPLEYVGKTDELGRLRVVSGLFDVRDRDRFPRAIVPSTLRLGFVVVADGFAVGLSERRLDRGGVEERRTLSLLASPNHAVFGSLPWRIALRLIDATPVDDGATIEAIDERLSLVARTVEPLVGRLPAELRQRAWGEVRARLVDRLFRRAASCHRVPLARRAVRASPDVPARGFRLAKLLAAVDETAVERRGTQNSLPRVSASESEAESLARSVLSLDPAFLPAAALLDELLVRRQAPASESLAVYRAMLRHYPFDALVRARLAEAALDAGDAVRAFDHLRYTWMYVRGLGGDERLARSLTDYYWRLGLPEKAGTFTWLLTGRPPEDPFVRIRGAR